MDCIYKIASLPPVRVRGFEERLEIALPKSSRPCAECFEKTLAGLHWLGKYLQQITFIIRDRPGCPIPSTHSVFIDVTNAIEQRVVVVRGMFRNSTPRFAGPSCFNDVFSRHGESWTLRHRKNSRYSSTCDFFLPSPARYRKTSQNRSVLITLLMERRVLRTEISSSKLGAHEQSDEQRKRFCEFPN